MFDFTRTSSTSTKIILVGVIFLILAHLLVKKAVSHRETFISLGIKPSKTGLMFLTEKVPELDRSMPNT